jgi:hypothetical protein
MDLWLAFYWTGPIGIGFFLMGGWYFGHQSPANNRIVL